MADIVGAIEDALGERVEGIVPLGGGDVARSYRVTLDDRVVFAKTKDGAPAGFFTTEAIGLRWLRAAAAIPVPDVIAVSDDPPLLVLEWIEPGFEQVDTEAEFGRSLAALHGAPPAHIPVADTAVVGA